MAMTNQAKNNATTIVNSSKKSVILFGDLAQNDSRISGLTFDDVVVNTGGKTLKEMAYDDKINTAQVTNSAKHTV